MFRKGAIRSQLAYAETNKMGRDFLIERFQSSIPDLQTTPNSSWTNVLSDICDLKSIELVQHGMCLHCFNFVLGLLNRSIQRKKPMTNVPATANIIYGEPRLRRMNTVSNTAANGCWLCTHVVRNARRKENGRIAASMVLSQAFNFSPDEF